jgi:hypothetical protein
MFEVDVGGALPVEDPQASFQRVLSLNDLFSGQAMKGLSSAKDGLYKNGPITTEFHSSANGFSFEMRMTTGRVGPEAVEKETEAVKPQAADLDDEEVDEIGRPLRPSSLGQPNLRAVLPVVAVQPQSDVTLYKIAGDECGQATPTQQ